MLPRSLLLFILITLLFMLKETFLFTSLTNLRKELKSGWRTKFPAGKNNSKKNYKKVKEKSWHLSHLNNKSLVELKPKQQWVRPCPSKVITSFYHILPNLKEVILVNSHRSFVKSIQNSKTKENSREMFKYWLMRTISTLFCLFNLRPIKCSL